LARPPFHLKHVRGILYLLLGAAGVFILLSCLGAPGDPFVGARELYGLWALGLLLAAMTVGPLTHVVPGLPLKAHLVLGRRALGIGAFAMASAHALCYLVPVGLRNASELVAPGELWLLGLGIGAFALAGLSVLALTSTDHQLIRIGGRRWKRWQESVYWLLPLLLVHGMLLGVDFGFHRAPDVAAAPDAGCLLGMGAFSLAWLGLFLCRRLGVRFPAPGAARNSPLRPG
jgi:DMSO/TMAO reductase YedYZ heme-binding membrane subunit